LGDSLELSFATIGSSSVEGCALGATQGRNLAEPQLAYGGVEYEHVKLNTVAECSVTIVAVWAKLTLKLNPFN
jgi:hypothetical protein